MSQRIEDVKKHLNILLHSLVKKVEQGVKPNFALRSERIKELQAEMAGKEIGYAIELAYEGDIEGFEAWVSANDEALIADDILRAHVYYLRGLILHNGGLYRQALWFYNRAISIHPKPEGIYYCDRGYIKEHLGNLQGRDDDFKIFAKLRPELARGLRPEFDYLL
ncbi:MAG TPA: hypothetical protein VK783_11105 [Bacteroidia bacterium]|jgi:hypothetical protein|nr:hypothetical protein [Bacteroidia bacterium]